MKPVRLYLPPFTLSLCFYTGDGKTKDSAQNGGQHTQNLICYKVPRKFGHF
jgi:hypothetical protein